MKPRLTNKVLSGLGAIAGNIEADFGYSDFYDESTMKEPPYGSEAALKWIREMQEWKSKQRKKEQP